MLRFGLMLSIACCCMAALGNARAEQRYPDRPIKVIVPYSPGGATDIVARIIGNQFSKLTGQNFVVVNKPGGHGLIALEQMARSKPDGYTVMIGNVATNAIAPVVGKDPLSINYTREVVPVSRLVDAPVFLLATTKNNFPVKTVDELIKYVKANPGKVRYGTSGVGSYPHYNMAYFAKRAGNLNMIAVPNTNGASGIIQDMLRGDVQVAFINVATTEGLVRTGQLRALAVGASARMTKFPDVPTLREAGFSGTGAAAWEAMFAPAGTPTPILAKLYADVMRAMHEPQAEKIFRKQTLVLVPNKSLADAKTWLANELDRWRIITKTVNLRADPRRFDS